MEKYIFQSEFAMVEVISDFSPNGARLRIKDLGSNTEIYLDPLELESLTRVDKSFFVSLINPANKDFVIPEDDLGITS